VIDLSSKLVRVLVVALSSAVTLGVLAATSQSVGQPTRPATTTAPADTWATGGYGAERLTFRYPQAWTLEPSQEGRGPLLYLQEPGGIACYWSVAARTVPPDETLDAMVERLAKGMGTLHREFKLRDKGVTVAADGTQRGHVEYDFRTETGGRAVQRQVLVPAGGGKVINVTEAGGAAQWESDGETLKQITESVRVAPARP
jgi:hypothetical protein